MSPCRARRLVRTHRREVAVTSRGVWVVFDGQGGKGREVWMWESGKDECVRTDTGPETLSGDGV
jgi:hypothetical protein